MFSVGDWGKLKPVGSEFSVNINLVLAVKEQMLRFTDLEFNIKKK